MHWNFKGTASGISARAYRATKPKNVATEKQSYGYNFSLEELDKSENLFQRGQPVPHEDQQGRSYEYQRERNES